MTDSLTWQWTMLHRYRQLLLLLLVLVLLLPTPTLANTDVSHRLFSYFRTYIDADLIARLYEKHTYRTEIDTHKLGDHVGVTTGKEFNDAFTALKNIQKRTIKEYKSHKWDKDLTYNYWDGFTHPLTSNNGSTLHLEHNERYMADVSMTESAINLPLDVYDNWTEVRNTIQWTSGLDKAFIQNNDKKADNIFWQYIGTPQGVMRTYPATYIPAKDQIDFDVRRRPWYNAGIGCPKDVILLMDTSGSLEGFPTRLLKNTAVKFLNEIISDTDFVTAIDVGYQAKFLTCYNHLTRANKIVKKTLIDAIKDIQPNGTSNWEAGFNLAFETFEKSRMINQSAYCEKAIVLFTDETGQPVDEIVAKLNTEKHVRIFVFSFRKNEGMYNDRLKGLACSNRGYYSKILYFGQIEAALQRLVQIGNTPLKDQTIQPTWSNAYKDLGGFGLVITVTLPVVVGTSESERMVTKVANNNSVSLLGIVGLDFKSSRIIQISSSVLPISSASVIINNKGYPVYHPRIDKYKYEDVNTRFHNFRWTDENKKDLIDLEKRMIDHDHFVLKTKGFLTYENQKRGSEWYQELQYQIYPVTSTPFSIACIYPTYPPTYFMYKLKTLNVEDIISILASNWTGQVLHNFHDNSCNVKKQLDRGHGKVDLDNTTCSAVIFSLFTDIYLSRYFKEAFKKYPAPAEQAEDIQIGGRSFQKDEILSHFIITYTGMVFFSNPKWNGANATTMATLTPYAQTVKNISAASLFISQPYRREIYNFRSVNITQRVNVTVDGVSSQVAAVGIEVRVELVREKLLGGHDDDLDRFLVDENGEIIMGYNNELGSDDMGDQAGHLGEHHPYLLKELIKRRIFNVVNYTECINECKETVIEHEGHHGSNAACTFKPFLYNLLAALMNFLTNLKLLFYFDYFLEVEANHIVKEKTVECCRMFNLYQRNFQYQDTHGTWINGDGPNGCQSHYEVSNVPSTNLLLVVDHSPGCKPVSEQITPYRGVRVYHHQGCQDGDDDHDIPDADGMQEEHKPSLINHYYRNFKTCIVSYTDEGMCSHCQLFIVSPFLIISAVLRSVLFWR